ncbi:MAG: hypothetical protein ABI574_02895 [Burkholderiales bacterium]
MIFRADSSPGPLRRRIVLATIALSFAAALIHPSASEAAAPAARFQAAFTHFNQAANGDNSSVDPAAEAFTALATQHPGDPVLLAYAGAATAMRARSSWLPWKKLSWAEDGLAQLDKALALLTPASDAPLYRGTPASLETRFVAANTFLALPSMLNRHARGEKLLNEVLGSPLFEAAPLPFKAAVWLRAGITAGKERPDDARRWLQRAVQSQTPQAPIAQAKLKELGL